MPEKKKPANPPVSTPTPERLQESVKPEKFSDGGVRSTETERKPPSTSIIKNIDDKDTTDK